MTIPRPPLTAEERAERERASVEADVRDTRDLSPSQRLERLAGLLAALTPLARQSPHWEAFASPQPMAVADRARWDALVAKHRHGAS